MSVGALDELCKFYKELRALHLCGRYTVEWRLLGAHKNLATTNSSVTEGIGRLSPVRLRPLKASGGKIRDVVD